MGSRTRTNPLMSDKLPDSKILGHESVKPGQSHDELDHSPPPLHNPAVHQSTAARPLTGKVDRQDRYFATDDIGLNKQVLGTHAPDYVDLDVKPVLSIIEDILKHCKSLDTVHEAQVPPHSESYEMSFQNAHYDAEIVQLLAHPINKISWEIICKIAAGGESHSAAIGLLEALSNYAWDAKVVVIFAAFSVSYGEFWLVEHFQVKHPLAKDIAALKDLPETVEHNQEMRKNFEAVFNLLQAVQTVTRIIIKFKELPTQYINRDSPEMATATAHIPTTVYWIIRSILACASILLNLVGSGHEYITSTSESWEILSLANKLSHMYEHLQTQLEILNGIIEANKRNEQFAALKKLFETLHIDNMKILRAIIRAREDQMPIFDGTRKITERLQVLRRKYVLLLITDLDLPHEELNILHLIYNQNSMRHEYEVLWLPIVDQATSMSLTQERQFFDLRGSMPWYSVDHPSLVDPVAIRYIREIWNFIHMPILVVLDPQGRVSNVNALPVMWIWGSLAFPFTKERELGLWRESTWNIDLLADSIDPRTQEWINDNKTICLYGGEDIDWIRKFTSTARSIANTLRFPLEMIYVGKSNPKDKVRRCHEIIDRERLSHIFSLKDYYDYVWYFWVRLGSMWNSKIQHGMTVETDKIMQEILTMLTYDGSEQGWAVFSRGKHDMTKGKGDILLTVFDNFGKWGQRVDHPDKFVPVLDEEITGLHPEHHCNRLILPGNTGYIPETVVCSDCGRIMDKYVMYRCCTD
ncbi:protein SIEVE ELEMENT OCCLUSION B-like [Olea europaea var. sylvestris]|uniref:protein SIEVE ELEMENT OCCLUSION B-like n=1 Tax=Olea europaea var. sylvestris TaxID=158386 RepID=UPI000C1D6EDB|nr:protein SIEVE ELEMENT OCCLUSION B-like [Olea europaea var. sylvestris]